MILRLIAKRLAFPVVVFWAASTIGFFVPLMSDTNPIRERFAELARSGGFSPGDLEVIIEAYTKQFGLDQPLIQQYWTYMGQILRFDFGYSLNRYPSTVIELIMQAIPWTLALLLVTTILGFVIGNLLGAISARPRSPGWLRSITTPFILPAGVPPVILGVLLIFFVGLRLKLLPLGGAYSIGIKDQLCPFPRRAWRAPGIRGNLAWRRQDQHAGLHDGLTRYWFRRRPAPRPCPDGRGRQHENAGYSAFGRFCTSGYTRGMQQALYAE